MHSKISEFEDKKAILDRYVVSADSNWNDEVKNRFFNDDINTLTSQFYSMDYAMKDVVSAIDSIERFINSL